MIAYYYLLMILEIITKAWADAQILNGWPDGVESMPWKYYHLPDLIHYIVFGIIIYSVRRDYRLDIQGLVFLFAQYVLIRFSMFDYLINQFRGKDLDYSLTFEFLGEWGVIVRGISIILAIVIGVAYSRYRKYFT